MARLYESREFAQLYELFSAPLMATIDADFHAAKKFIDYLVAYAFEPAGEASEDQCQAPRDWGRLKTISFSYESLGSQGLPVRNTIRIPLISLIPLPILQVDHATFDMEVRILGFGQEAPDPLRTWSLPEKGARTAAEPGGPGVVLASLSPLRQGSERLSPSLRSHLKAHLAMRVSDLPAGISRLLNVVQDATRGLAEPLTDVLTVEVLPMTEQDRIVCRVQLRDPDGRPLASAPVRARCVEGGPACTLAPIEALTNSEGSADFLVTAKDPSHPTTVHLTFSGERSPQAECRVRPFPRSGDNLP